jgi:hypothetical protein
MVSRNTNMPMFPLPEEELIIGFGMYPTMPKSQLQPVLEELNLLTNLAFHMGGKRYMASWAEFDLAQWRLQFGDYWTKVNEMKRKYDPKGILNPGFFQYEQFALPQMYKQQIQLTEDVITESKVESSSSKSLLSVQAHPFSSQPTLPYQSKPRLHYG